MNEPQDTHHFMIVIAEPHTGRTVTDTGAFRLGTGSDSDPDFERVSLDYVVSHFAEKRGIVGAVVFWQVVRAHAPYAPLH